MNQEAGNVVRAAGVQTFMREPGTVLSVTGCRVAC